MMLTWLRNLSQKIFTVTSQTHNRKKSTIPSNLLTFEKTFQDNFQFSDLDTSIQEASDQNSLPQPSTIQQPLKEFPQNGEYAGPVIINSPQELDGKGATLWALKGPVLIIRSDNVKVSNIRIEVTGQDNATSSERCSVLVETNKNPSFDNVELRGTAMGLSDEEGEWKYPQSLNLENLAAYQKYVFLLRIYVPVTCTICTDISGIDFNPCHLDSGYREIQLTVDELPNDVLIYGHIFLVTKTFKRRITLTSHVGSTRNLESTINSEEEQPSIIWQPTNWPDSSMFSISSTSDGIEGLSYNFEKIPLESKSSVHLVGSNQGKEAPKLRRGQKPNVNVFQSEPIEFTKQSQTITKPSDFQINPLFEQTNKPDIVPLDQSTEGISDVSPKQLISPIFDDPSKQENI